MRDLLTLHAFGSNAVGLFGPFPRGSRLSGLWVHYANDPDVGIDRFFGLRLGARTVSETSVLDTGDVDDAGLVGISHPNFGRALVFPTDTTVYVPLDVVFDRFSWLTARVFIQSNGGFITIGLGRLPFTVLPQSAHGRVAVTGAAVRVPVGGVKA